MTLRPFTRIICGVIVLQWQCSHVAASEPDAVPEFRVPPVDDHNWKGAGSLVDKAKSQAGRQRADLPSGTTTGNPDPPSPQEELGDPTPLGVNLTRLRLVTKSSKAGKAGKSSDDLTPGHVVVDPALHPPARLANELDREFTGQPLSVALLNRVVKKVIKSYQATDYPFVDAFLPEQDITSGVIQVVVIEATLGGVKVEGATHSKPSYMKGQIRVKPGERINTAILERDVQWLNENPGRSVAVVYERGVKEGTSDIVLKTEDTKPLEVYAGFGNTGILATGENEWSAGFNWTHFLGTEQSLGYNFTGNETLDAINAHALVYNIPFPWRHNLQLIGVYATTNVLSGAPGEEVNVEGLNTQASAIYTIPLPRPWSKALHHITIAADYKSTNSNIFFGGQDIIASAAQVLQFGLGYDLSFYDSLGSTHLGLSGVYSPGNLLKNNTDAAFELLRFGSQANYFYSGVEFDRLVRLPKGFILTLHAAGQYSNYRLISTEQIQAGGYRTVRGFDESLIRGDSGVITNVELSLPPFQLLKWIHEKTDELTIFGFYDAAWLTSADATIEEPNQSLQSVGVGLRYRLLQNSDIRLAYGWVVGSSGIADPGSGRLHFGAVLKY